MTATTTELRRGFKAEAKRIAAQQRTMIGLGVLDPLNPHLLAMQLGAKIVTPNQVPSLAAEHRDELLNGHPDTWSALSATMSWGTLIVHNPTHDNGRTNNTLCHELGHLILRHEHGAMHTLADCMMRDYDPEQEGEADWLAGELLVTLDALKAAKRRLWTHQQTAVHLGVSEQLLRWRWNKSGIDKYMR